MQAVINLTMTLIHEKTQLKFLSMLVLWSLAMTFVLSEIIEKGLW